MKRGERAWTSSSIRQNRVSECLKPHISDGTVKIVFEGTQTRSEADGPVRCHPNPRRKRGKHSVIIGHQFNGDGMLTWPSHNGINNSSASFRLARLVEPGSLTCLLRTVANYAMKSGDVSF